MYLHGKESSLLNPKGVFYMLHRLKYYRNPNESRLNTSIMNREYEKNLELYVVDAFKSISSTLTEIEMVDYEFIIDVEKVDRSKYERTRKPSKKAPQKIAYIKESWLGELIMHFKVDMSEYQDLVPEKAKNDPKDKDYIPPEMYYTVKMLVPVTDSKGNYMLRGVKYTNQYQLTEASTYVTPGNLVEKSLMPVRMKRYKVNAVDINGDTLILDSFSVQMFTGFVNIMYFFLSEYGWYDTLEMFSVGEYIELIDSIEDGVRPDSTYIKLNSTYLRVLTSALSSNYVQSIAGTLVDALTGKAEFQDIITEDFWIRKIGATKKGSVKDSHYDLGLKHKKLFNRMLDYATQDILKLEQYNKDDILSLIRWMAQNYNELKQKDNLDILYKRLRGNEYIASLLNGIISERIKKLVNRASNTPQKVMTKYKNFFSYKGNELISQCHNSGLIKYDDLVNDMTMFEKFKITMKGPNAVGNKNQRNVNARMRALHPSHIGRIGITISSPSDPGLTNYLNPLVETDGLFFKDAPPEPERFMERLMSEMNIPNDEEHSSVVIVDPVKFQGVLYNLQKNVGIYKREKPDIDNEG